MMRSIAFAHCLGFVLAFASLGCGDNEGESELGVGQGGQSGGAAGTSSGGTGNIMITGGTNAGGTSAGGTSSGDAGGNGACSPTLTGIVRDFKAHAGGLGHPDFETFTGNGEAGLVQVALGSDHKPVFSHTGDWSGTTGGCDREGQTGVRCVTSPDSYDQWYRDVSGVNQPVEFIITPTVGANGVATYDNSSFFPIDGVAFGNEGRSHNYHFTFELHMEFSYQGGEIFSFTGDDDLWVFVNNRLAIDLGGLHQAQSAVLDLDSQAATLGIERGKVYPLDFFHAERHTSASNFKIQSTLNFTNCTPIVY